MVTIWNITEQREITENQKRPINLLAIFKWLVGHVRLDFV